MRRASGLELRQSRRLGPACPKLGDASDCAMESRDAESEGGEGERRGWPTMPAPLLNPAAPRRSRCLDTPESNFPTAREGARAAAATADTPTPAAVSKVKLPVTRARGSCEPSNMRSRRSLSRRCRSSRSARCCCARRCSALPSEGSADTMPAPRSHEPESGAGAGAPRDDLGEGDGEGDAAGDEATVEPARRH